MDIGPIKVVEKHVLLHVFHRFRVIKRDCLQR